MRPLLTFLGRGTSSADRGVPSATATVDGAAAADRLAQTELRARRDQLTARFSTMQSELGGLFYEMAIRDHVRLDVLAARAAELQRVDAQLAQVEHLLAQGGGAVGGRCPACGAMHARGAAYCAQCAAPLAAT